MKANTTIHMRMEESQRALERGRELRRKARSIVSSEFVERVGRKLEGILRQKERRWFAPSVSPNRVSDGIKHDKSDSGKLDTSDLMLKSMAKEMGSQSAGNSVRRKTWNIPQVDQSNSSFANGKKTLSAISEEPPSASFQSHTFQSRSILQNLQTINNENHKMFITTRNSISQMTKHKENLPQSAQEAQTLIIKSVREQISSDVLEREKLNSLAASIFSFLSGSRNAEAQTTQRAALEEVSVLNISTNRRKGWARAK
ncbi:hypothetical protein FGO68_gene12140 [Halteria grandinella]|uniref:Uncharacterized protein n=1 Tax=Halteria grandinella TaxID=5974 RepID=A0A8J8NF38_HALGN|nr:hypothetical protein FGO68_gene12140 [Halteria grandinella]